MSQMERGERPPMQEQEDSEEGETPTDPSAGEWWTGGLEPWAVGLSTLEGPAAASQAVGAGGARRKPA